MPGGEVEHWAQEESQVPFKRQIAEPYPKTPRLSWQEVCGGDKHEAKKKSNKFSKNLLTIHNKIGAR